MADTDAPSELQDGVEPLQDALESLEGLADNFGRAMTSAFRNAVFEGEKLEDVLRSLALSLAGSALNALAPIGQGLADALGGMVGGSSQAGAVPDALPTGGRAAGDRSGRGSGQPSIVVNVAARDAESFRRSEAEIGAMLARAVARGRRGL